MNFLKTHWPGFVHIVAAIVILADPSAKAFLASHPQYAGIGLIVWAEIMRWAQSPRQ